MLVAVLTISPDALDTMQHTAESWDSHQSARSGTLLGGGHPKSSLQEKGHKNSFIGVSSEGGV